ncbi:rRNA maturation RNase YbeY [Alkalicoccus urumqiensis]|uniref:Endoribonuclease YbeY n=1 Tax=Alkalicoccus urumqiensis TaxID=1548213 RepID=A0A2P6MFP1_ALKUR|nr:rRNA maturation RNase YbeY [Alkalicoccus urumqiensis]PRO65106.1 rRNA maturation RNase YbeY [Alkalicoccus urumqiensis]
MNPYEIVIQDETNTVKEELIQLVESVLETGLKEEEAPEGAEVSVTFVTDKEIHSLNLEWRGKDKSTDVLSFALKEEEDIPVAGVPELLGDIVISTETAAQQAETYGHSIERETAFLAVHGLLHLLGYTHNTEDEEKEMFLRQEQILEKHGVSK